MEVTAVLLLVLPGLVIGFAVAFFLLSFFRRINPVFLLILSLANGIFFGFIVGPVVGVIVVKEKNKREEAYAAREKVYFKSALTGAFSEHEVQEHYKNDVKAMNTLDWHSNGLVYAASGMLSSHATAKADPQMIILLSRISYSKAIKHDLSILPEAPVELKHNETTQQ